MGDVVSFPISLDSDLGRELIVDCVRFAEGILDERQVRKNGGRGAGARATAAGGPGGVGGSPRVLRPGPEGRRWHGRYPRECPDPDASEPRLRSRRTAIRLSIVLVHPSAPRSEPGRPRRMTVSISSRLSWIEARHAPAQS